MVQQIVFLVTLALAVWFISRRIAIIRSNLRLGKDITTPGDRPQRWRNMLLVAFGQKKMFKRFIPAFLHWFIYVGFLVINIEVLEFIVDGITGKHRTFAPYIGSFYNVLMNIFEFLAVAVLLSCVVFLLRRNVLKVRRFWMYEMTRWPRLDANIILVTEIALMLAI